MSIGSILKEKIKEKIQNMNFSNFGMNANSDPPTYQYGERLTQDKKVIALRRQRNRQMDMIEKERLEKSIRTFEQVKAKRDFVGESSVLGNKRLSRKKPSVKTKSLGFISKSKF